MRSKVHVRGVHPAEKRLAGLVLARDEVLGGGDELVVAGLHPFAGQRTGVFDLLLADPTPARLLRGVVLVGRPAAQHAARAEGRLELRELLRIRIVRIFRIFFGVEVIEIAEEFIEAMNRRQVLVKVAEVVLAELTGGVTLRLQQLCDGRVLRLQAHIHARRANFRKTRAKYALSGDECRATRGAALFAVGIGEEHSLGGDAVDVGRSVAHHAAAVA